MQVREEFRSSRRISQASEAKMPDSLHLVRRTAKSTGMHLDFMYSYVGIPHENPTTLVHAFDRTVVLFVWYMVTSISISIAAEDQFAQVVRMCRGEIPFRDLHKDAHVGRRARLCGYMRYLNEEIFQQLILRTGTCRPYLH